MGTFSRSESGPVPDADASLAELFASEREGMVRMATLLVDSAAMAEEIVQESFIAVRERWDEIDRPGAYLRTTVVNGCSAALRRRSVEERFQRGLQEPRFELLPTRLVELREALGCLSERQRVVVVLRYFVDVSDHDIAHQIEVRPSTVRSLRRRALSVLRKELS
jgi:RNA polymerase sigma factor (sigma-70 family)